MDITTIFRGRELAENRSKPDQFMLRMPEGLRVSLRYAAETTGASINSEIVGRLEQSLLLDLPKLPPDLIDRIQSAPADVRAQAERAVTLNMLDTLNTFFPPPPPRITSEDVLQWVGQMVERMPPEEIEAARQALAGDWQEIAKKAAEKLRRRRVRHVEESLADRFGEGEIGRTDMSYVEFYESEEGQEYIRQRDAREASKSATPVPVGSPKPPPATSKPQREQRAVSSDEKASSGSGQRVRKINTKPRPHGQGKTLPPKKNGQ